MLNPNVTMVAFAVFSLVVVLVCVFRSKGPAGARGSKGDPGEPGPRGGTMSEAEIVSLVKREISSLSFAPVVPMQQKSGGQLEDLKSQAHDRAVKRLG